ncbi:unnamed protein product [Euphydryas editha]|uniref:Gustatory receptor n=1 Tax=Euphydryas editha TaxID=104508 RepID=A0AAU9V7Z0_EUPED|nr:unnamed protein product [Euphydryas editha]
MKLPFSVILGPILKTYFRNSKVFCQHYTFSVSVAYTYVFSALGLCINIHHLKKHLGETTLIYEASRESNKIDRNVMLVHDLKIIAISMGLIQYICLLFGCFTENPSLFLPHLGSQLVIVCVKIVNTFLVLIKVDMESLNKFRQRLTSVALMTFNWLQEFCVFRQHLCICDL